MKNPDNHYPNPFVPEYMTKMTIDKIPYDKAYYIDPGQEPPYGAPKIFVTSDRRLRMSTSHPIDAEDAYPHTPLGLVGIMKVAWFDSERQEPREALIADLRFVEFHELADSTELSEDLEDDELAELIGHSVGFDGFIAPEHNPDSEVDIPKSELYGPSELIPYLKQLKKNGNKIMKRYMKAQVAAATKSNEVTKPVVDAHPAPKENKLGQQAIDCAVVFIEPKMN